MGKINGKGKNGGGRVDVVVGVHDREKGGRGEMDQEGKELVREKKTGMTGIKVGMLRDGRGWKRKADEKNE